MRLAFFLGLATALAFGQNPSPFTCFADASTPVIRPEGLAELMGDIGLTCTGGTPTPAGQAVPKFNFSLTASFTVTNRTLNSNITDTALLLDDLANHILGTESTTILATGTGDHPVGSPNLFYGRLQGLNTVTWIGVPIDPPGPSKTRRVRIKRINGLPVVDGRGHYVQVSVDDENGASIFDAFDLPVATLGPKTNVEVFGGSARSDASTQGAFTVVRFQEGFETAFKTRHSGISGTLGAPAAKQERSPLSETGFFDPAIDPVAGLAGTGTMVCIWVSNIPPGMQIIFPGTNQTGADVFRLVSNCTGTGIPVPLDSNGKATPTPSNGSLLIGYELVTASNTKSDVRFTLDEFYPANAPLQETQVIRVGAFLGPTRSLPQLLSDAGLRAPLFNSYVDDTAVPFEVYDILENAGWKVEPGGEVRRATASSQPAVNVSVREAIATLINRDILVRASSDVDRLLGLTVSETANVNSEPLQSAPIRAGTTNWLTATLNQTSAPASVRVSANPAGLAPGTYKGSVTIATTTPGVSPATVPITLRVPPANQPAIKSFGYGIGSAASYVSNKIAPGEAVVVFGSNFGPAQIATLKLSNGTTADTTLGGTRLLFDGVPAPLIYSVSGVVSGFVPFGIAGKKFVQVVVEQDGLKSEPVTVPVAAAVPGLLTANFSGGGQGSFLSADYKFNGDFGALPGDFILIFGTGAGELASPVTDGGINAGGALKATVRKVFLDGVEVPFDYFGPGPGQIEGIFQVNVRLPSNVRRNANVPVQVQVGDAKSQPGVTIRVK
jgi:uncharacterized protein (TIGR03437 family)